jgi:hypothetical protein
MKFILCIPPVLAAIASLGIIVFNVHYRGHYVYCQPMTNCLSLETLLRFSVPFVFNFIRLSLGLYAIIIVVTLVRRLIQNFRGRVR